MNRSICSVLRLAIGVVTALAGGACGSPEGFHRTTGTGGSTSFGTGGSPTFGSGGSPTFGTGGSPTFGTGGSPTFGSGGSPTFGTGGSPTFGTGGRGGSTFGTGGSTFGTGGGTGTGGAAGLSGTGGADPMPCPTCMLSVTYAPTGTADSQAIAGEVHVSTNRAVAINQISVKYWYTNETGSTSITTDIDYVGLSTGVGLTKPDVTGAPTSLVTPATANANTVTSITIPETSMLNPGTSLYIKFRIHATNYQGIFMMANDYSFGATQVLTMPWAKITAYVGGTKAWGDEP